jgi:hypothetical protein
MLYLAIVFALFLTILHRDNGIFTYTLDDPYIHLALAQNLAHGHYGINPGEPSSPSSSILWPFLLVPFSGHVYAPLLWNILFCSLAAWLIGRTVTRWKWKRPFANARATWWTQFAAASLLMLIANLAGLTFIGMEHGLQVLLAVACAAGIVEAIAGRPIPAWCVAAAALGPMVRYENLALTAAIAIALVGQRRARTALTLIGVSVAGPLLFSVFLLSRGLPPLPSSVLVKARTYAYAAHSGPLMSALATLLQNIYWGLIEVAWYLQLLVFLLLAWLTRRERRRLPRYALAGAAIAALLQLLLGRYNWFYRYEVYALSFSVLVAAAALVQTTSVRRSILFTGLSLAAAPYAYALYLTPAAASNVYQQQYQMHRFLATFPGHTVAVNDLGLVSYDRPAGLYILDLWGLASPEASRHPDKNTAWLDAITRAHNAGLAVLYPDWYPEGVPDDWQPLGTMCTTSRRISIAHTCVAFYSTPQGNHAALQSELSEFSRTLPTTVKMTLGIDTSDEDNDP